MVCVNRWLISKRRRLQLLSHDPMNLWKFLSRILAKLLVKSFCNSSTVKNITVYSHVCLYHPISNNTKHKKYINKQKINSILYLLPPSWDENKIRKEWRLYRGKRVKWSSRDKEQIDKEFFLRQLWNVIDEPTNWVHFCNY